ncbi:MAG TPA: rhodanese-like domain-containing protein [Tepidisphaeraceae bacterium]
MCRITFLIFFIVAVIPVASPGAETSPSRPRELAPSGPYCGLYSLYAAARLSGAKVPIQSLLKTEYLSSREGSTADDLLRASRSLGMYTAVMDNLDARSLRSSPYLCVLHVKSTILAHTYDHWLLYLGVSKDGQARIFDPPEPEQHLPFTQLVSHWDGNAILVSPSPVDITVIQRSGLRPVIGWIVFAVVVVGLAHLARRRLPARLGHSARGRIALSLVQACAVLALGSVIALAHHKLDPEESLTDPAMLLAIEHEHFDEFAAVTASQLRTMIQSGGLLVIDARYQQDYEAGHIDGALSIPVTSTREEIRSALGNRPQDAPIVIYCQSEGCPFARKVAVQIALEGYTNLMLFRGGWFEWKSGGYIRQQSAKGAE